MLPKIHMSIAYRFILDRVGEYRNIAGTVACTFFLPRLFVYLARLVTTASKFISWTKSITEARFREVTQGHDTTDLYFSHHALRRSMLMHTGRTAMTAPPSD